MLRKGLLAAAVVVGPMLWAAVAGAGELGLATCRPRLFIRPEAWRGGLSVEQLRQRAGESPFKERVHLLRTTTANLALKWLIFKDEQAAAEALGQMNRAAEQALTSEDGVQLIDLALGYDWLFTWSGFSEDAKRAAEKRMLTDASRMRDELAGEGAHVFHTRMYAWTAAVGIAGLAIHDRQAEGRKLFEFAKEYYEKRLIPARRLQGGAMHNGLTYGPNYMMFPLVQFLKAAKSAAGIDWFHTADPADSAWLREMADYLLYTIQPDLEYVNFSDQATRSPAKHFRFLLDIFAAEYGNRQAAEMARRISERYETSGYHAEYIYMYLCFCDPVVTPAPLDSLPTARVFGQPGLGQVFWRSGWGEKDMMVFFRCGDYFGNHGHFDQGSFTLFRGAELALKGGCYIGFDVAHRHHYYKQAISNNTVLFSDGADDEGRQRNINYQHANTVEQYEQNRKLVETGDLVAVDDPAWIRSHSPGCHSLVADVTAAWDPAKVKRFRRQMAFLGGKNLVVVDETETVRPTTRARWLLHAQTEPTAADGLWKVAAGDSVLWVRPLLPAEPKVTLIGSPGHECDVNGTNYSYMVAEPGDKRKPPKQPDPALGLWRMEIESPAAEAKRLFVTVLTADAAGATPPPATVARGEQGLTVRVGRASVTFLRAGE